MGKKKKSKKNKREVSFSKNTPAKHESSPKTKPEIKSYNKDLKMAIKKAFEYNGIEFYGSPKFGLEDLSKTSNPFKNNDLIINCTGDLYKEKPFVKSLPSWLNFNFTSFSPSQLLLDWIDFGIPPMTYDKSFWDEVLAAIEAQKIKRVFVCCAGGKGRTGTALACLMVASGMAPEDAINKVRESYLSEAIERTEQEFYVLRLVYNNEQAKEANKKIKPRATTTSYAGSYYRHGNSGSTYYQGGNSGSTYQGGNVASSSKPEEKKDSKDSYETYGWE